MSSDGIERPRRRAEEPEEGLHDTFRVGVGAPMRSIPAAREVELEPEPDAESEVDIDEASDENPEKKRVDWVKIGLSVLAAALFIGAAVILFIELFGGSEDLRDMDGNRVEADTNVTNDEEWVQRADLREIPGARFIVDQVSLDVPYGEVNEVDGVINPPNYLGAFRVRNRGVDLPQAAEGTVYVATHSVRGGGRAPGNYLMNMYDYTWSLQPGDIINVNGTHYVAHSHMTIDNNNLGSRPELWADVPGRLVLITCMQRPDATSPEQNLIIIAYLEGYAP